MTAGVIPLEAFVAGTKASGEAMAFVGFRHGTMRAIYYAPGGGEDRQSPHTQDELYIVHQGQAVFRKAEETQAIGPGDVIFVEAGVDHNFRQMSPDFAVWAVFWGPVGGEG